MELHKGIIENNNLEDAINYVGHELTIIQIVFLMKCLGPDFIEIDNNIYILSYYKDYGSSINRFDNSKEGKEKYINNLSISDMFYFSNDGEFKNQTAQIEKGNYILEFWKMRLQYLFTDKTFEFILYEEGLFDESGVCITFYSN
ncbi:hypothetical protein CMV00_01800 [Elizabethkingia anophelis]|nr:hypothetical protein [Elizabethkingia anophelis]